ncbi:cuticle protein 16.5 [Eurosta solidaginis]|uniref:cuticle protein 16.5 n=1 Tax=Eurosta solidaginis TaxID=178769 RepID=UPI00353109E2
MALKVIFVITALIACAHAKPGGPAAYSISAPSADHASVGNTQEHTVKGHYGQSSQSDYSSAVQTAHSQSHVQRSSTSNDAGVAPHIGEGHVIAAAAPAIYASHGYTAPAASYAAHGYTAPGYAAPALSHGFAYASPITYHAPSYSYQAAPAPALHYSAPSYGHYAAPSASYSHGYVAAPAATVKYSSAPSYVPYGHPGYAHGLSYAAPALAHYGAPVVKAVAAPALVHASVAGHGVHYGY